MAYVAPTIADFRERFPKLTIAVVPDTMVQKALDRAATKVDETWTEGDFAEGRLLYAAAWLTAAGYGTGADAVAAAAGASGFKMMKSGALTLERFDNASESAGNADPTLDNTYGGQFLALQALNVGGPMVSDSGCATPSHLARDWPFGFGWEGS